MIQIDALKVLHDDGTVQVYAQAKLKIPLELAVRDGLGPAEPSLRRTPRHLAGHRRRHVLMPGEMGELELTARHALRDPMGRVRRFRGLIVGARLAPLVDFLRERYVVEPGGALADWTEDGVLDWDRLASSLEGNLALADRLRARWDRITPSHPVPGVRWSPVGTSPLEDLSPLALRGTVWLLGTAAEGVEYAADLRHDFGGHSVPVRVSIFPDDAGVRWFDGQRFGYVEDLGGVPARLLERLRRDGRAERATPDTGQPLADYVPRLLVRAPTERERKALWGAPPPAPGFGPGLLLPTRAPVVLLSPDGSPLPLPVVTATRDALAILGRTSTQGVYVPGMPPRDMRDVRLPGAGRWFVLTDPFGAAA